MPRTVLMSVLNALTPMFVSEKQSAIVCEVLSVLPDASLVTKDSDGVFGQTCGPTFDWKPKSTTEATKAIAKLTSTDCCVEGRGQGTIRSFKGIANCVLL